MTTTTPDQGDERRAFEGKFPRFDLRLSSLQPDQYADLRVQFMWEAWQARATQPVAQEAIQWPTMPPSKGQSPVLFEDGYAEGWAKCLDECKAALAAPQPSKQENTCTSDSTLSVTFAAGVEGTTSDAQTIRSTLEFVPQPSQGAEQTAADVRAIHERMKAELGELDRYDAGLLSDYGGGNVEWWQDYIRAELDRAHDFYASQAAPPHPASAEAGKGVGLAVELRGVAEVLAEGKGFWRSCTGCHELNEGHPTGIYSPALKCHLGLGCDECGGIGAIWDETDYDAMAEFMANPPSESVAVSGEVSEEVVLAAIKACSGFGKVSLTYESGPYDIDRPTNIAMSFAKAVLTLAGSGGKA